MTRLTTAVLARLAEDAQAHIDGHRYDYVLLPDTLLALLAEVTASRKFLELVRRFRATPIVDPDFPALRNEVDETIADTLSTLERLT